MLVKKEWMLLKGIVLSVVVLGLCACSGGKAGKGSDKSLYEQGLDVVALMAEMARTDGYVEIYSGSQEMCDAVKNIGKGDFTRPKAVYEIKADTESLALASGMKGLEGASEELKQSLKQKLLAAFMMQVNGMDGAVSLASSDVCAAEKNFVNTEVTEDTIYLYTYEDALPAAVTFLTGEDGAVSANGVFIMFDEFTCGSEAEIESFFRDGSVEAREVETK